MKESNKITLLASSASLEGINKSVAAFYFGSKKEPTEIEPNIWSVPGTKGVLQGIRVIKKGKRYRFEMVK